METQKKKPEETDEKERNFRDNIDMMLKTTERYIEGRFEKIGGYVRNAEAAILNAANRIVSPYNEKMSLKLGKEESEKQVRIEYLAESNHYKIVPKEIPEAPIFIEGGFNLLKKYFQKEIKFIVTDILPHESEKINLSTEQRKELENIVNYHNKQIANQKRKNDRLFRVY